MSDDKNNKIISIVKNTKQEEPKQVSGERVVESLEQALAMAKDGHIKNVVVVCILNNGDVMDVWANGLSRFTMLGALRFVATQFSRIAIGNRTPVN